MDGNNAPLITAVGGVLLFISLLLSWFGDFSAWELFDLSDIVLALIAILAIVVGGSRAAGSPVGVSPSAVLYGGLIALGMVATYTFEGEERKFGLILAILGVLAIVAGALGLGRTAPAARAPRTEAAPPPPPAAGP